MHALSVLFSLFKVLSPGGVQSNRRIAAIRRWNFAEMANRIFLFMHEATCAVGARDRMRCSNGTLLMDFRNGKQYIFLARVTVVKLSPVPTVSAFSLASRHSSSLLRSSRVCFAENVKPQAECRHAGDPALDRCSFLMLSNHRGRAAACVCPSCVCVCVTAYVLLLLPPHLSVVCECVCAQNAIDWHFQYGPISSIYALD